MVEALQDTPILAPLLEARAELYERSLPTPEWLAFWTAAGPFDHAIIGAHAGSLSVLPVQFFADRTFDLTESGRLSAVVEVLDCDGETVVDLVAWPIDRPDKFATFHHRADALGVGQVQDPATYLGSRPLLVHRTPLAWLQAGCSGVVVLNELTAPRWLGAACGRIAGADVQHARELARLLYPFIEPHRIVVPIQEAA
jgi:hypothetical protein